METHRHGELDRPFIAAVLTLGILAGVLYVVAPSLAPPKTQPATVGAAHDLHAEPRSPKWPTVRRHHLEIEPACAVCGCRKDVEVHHCLPFHLHPEKELDESNLISLCREHHLLFGHLGNFRSWNATVREDAATWARKIKERP